MSAYEAEIVRQLADQMTDRPGEAQWPEDFGLTLEEGLVRRDALRVRLLALADQIESEATR